MGQGRKRDVYDEERMTGRIQWRTGKKREKELSGRSQETRRDFRIPPGFEVLCFADCQPRAKGRRAGNRLRKRRYANTGQKKKSIYGTQRKEKKPYKNHIESKHKAELGNVPKAVKRGGGVDE